MSFPWPWRMVIYWVADNLLENGNILDIKNSITVQ